MYWQTARLIYQSIPHLQSPLGLVTARGHLDWQQQVLTVGAVLVVVLFSH